MAETCYCTDTCGLRGCTSGHTPWCHGGCFQLSVKGKTPALTSQIQHPLIFVPSLASTAAARISTLSIQCVFTLQSVHLQLLLLFFPTCFLFFFPTHFHPFGWILMVSYMCIRVHILFVYASFERVHVCGQGGKVLQVGYVIRVDVNVYRSHSHTVLLCVTTANKPRA